MPQNTKRVLIFAAKLGYQTRSFDEAAGKLGVDLIFVTDRCHQLDDPWGDRAIPVHFESPEVAAYEVLQSVRSGQPAIAAPTVSSVSALAASFSGAAIDGILALGDRPAVTAAYVARGLGIPYNHPAAVEACRSKLRMREIFREAVLPVPWFRNIALNPSPEPALLGISYPCVLKPLSLSASQGVIRANNREEFLAAAQKIRKLLASPAIAATRELHLDHILVEGYIPGREVALEGVLIDGNLRSLAIFDKPDPLEGPYFEETIYATPSRLPESEQRAIERTAAAAARAIGLSHGPVHAEFRISDQSDRPTQGDQSVWPLEIAPRPIGGLCSRALRFAAPDSAEEIGLEELLLRHALDMPGPTWPRESAAAAVMMIPVPQSGILEKVDGESEARATPAITELHVTARLHDYIAAWPEGSTYLGFLFARADTPAEAESALRDAHKKLKFTLTPRLPVEHPATRTIVD